MTKDKEQGRAKRRDFLKLLGLGGVATATVAVAGDAPEAKASEAGPADARGYRETEHVKKFYETARF